MKAEHVLSEQILIFVPIIYQSDDTDSNALEFTFASSIERRSDKLSAAIEVTWKETNNDSIKLAGASRKINFFDVEQRFPEWNIKSVNSITSFDFKIADPILRLSIRKHRPHTHVMGSSSLISFYKFVCDGDDVLTAVFKPVDLVLEQYLSHNLDKGTQLLLT